MVNLNGNRFGRQYERRAYSVSVRLPPGRRKTGRSGFEWPRVVYPRLDYLSRSIRDRDRRRVDMEFLMTQAVNPICGKQNCKYKVPHEHVWFTGVPTPPVEPIVNLGSSPNFFADPLSPEAIEAKLRASPLQDDPSADRFQPKAESLPVPPWAAILTTNFERLYGEVENRNIQLNTMENSITHLQECHSALQTAVLGRLKRLPSAWVTALWVVIFQILFFAGAVGATAALLSDHTVWNWLTSAKTEQPADITGGLCGSP